MIHGELFAGIGGFGRAFGNVGIETKWHVEIDKSCQSVLRLCFPNAQVESDVCEVGKHNLDYVDIVSFGSPCQDLSIAGLRKGFQDGTRSNLFFEAARIVREINPRYAIWENVPGALSSHGGADFKSVLESLLDTEVPMPKSGRWATAGMVRIGQKEIAWRILDAQYFGVPQRRRRIFLIFCPRGDSAAEILFESEGMSGDTPPRREAGEIAPTLPASGAGTSRPGGQGAEVDFYVRVFDRQRSDEYGEAKTVSTVSARDYKSATDLIATPWDSQRARIHDANGIAPTLQSGGKAGRNEAPTIAYTWRRTNFDGQEDLSPTLNMGGGGGGMPAVGVRRLTPTECLRLQGFPDDWLDGESDTQKYKQCGNAVAVPVVEWIAKRIVAAETGG